MSGSIAKQIGLHLPYLRRHARALTGSQVSGDAFVRAALTALVEGDEALDSRLPPRVGLYRLFHALWSSASAEDRPGAQVEEIDSDAAGFDTRLARITPASRQAFLLVAMEGFSAAEVAKIMALEPSDVAGLIEQAHGEIEAQTRTEVFIIEDEPLIAMDLQRIVEQIGHTVAGVARTHDEALELCEKIKPGLILSDIQLADGSSGLEATNELLKSLKAPVIFITAFPERLLSGDRPEPAFLITKPFNDATVRAAIAQSLFFNDSAVSSH